MRNRHIMPWLALLLLAIAVMGLLDLTFDIFISVPNVHLAAEIVFLFFCLATALYLGVGWYRSQRSVSRMRANADRARVFMEGLSRAIEMQLLAWGLNDAERTTALYLLKGVSHKDIATATNRSESTIRQHAVEIYRKSGLAGRAELSAFFLEDLLLPNAEPTGVTAQPDETGSGAGENMPHPTGNMGKTNAG